MLIVCFCLSAFSQASDFTSITLIVPEKAQTIYEHRQTIPSNNMEILPNTVTFDMTTTQKITDEIDCIDMGLSADLLPSDQPEVPIYAEPSLTALKIGRISYPAKAQIIKVTLPFVCVKVSPEKKGWIHQRHVDTQDFWQKYTTTRTLLYQTIATSFTNDQSLVSINQNASAISTTREFDLAEINSTMQVITTSQNFQFILHSPDQITQATIIFNDTRIPLRNTPPNWIGEFSGTVPSGNQKIKVFCVQPDGKLLSLLREATL
jgi:hypothetical protein